MRWCTVSPSTVHRIVRVVLVATAPAVIDTVPK